MMLRNLNDNEFTKMKNILKNLNDIFYKNLYQLLECSDNIKNNINNKINLIKCNSYPKLYGTFYLIKDSNILEISTSIKLETYININNNPNGETYGEVTYNIYAMNISDTSYNLSKVMFLSRNSIDKLISSNFSIYRKI